MGWLRRPKVPKTLSVSISISLWCDQNSLRQCFTRDFSQNENDGWIDPIEEISYKAEIPFGSIRSIDVSSSESFMSLRKVRIFGHDFNAAPNAEELIVKQYGSDWMNAKTRQFAWFPQDSFEIKT